MSHHDGDGATHAHDDHHTDDHPRGDSGEPAAADTASGGAPEGADLTTDEHGRPVDNPSGG